MQGSASLHINASIDRVWSLVSDVTRIGSFSPETFEAEWLNGATAPQVGVQFRGHVKRNGIGPVYWDLCEITDCVPNELFAFKVTFRGATANTWGYRLAEEDGGTLLTEFFALPRTLGTRIYWSLFGRARGKTNQEGMMTTLVRMREVLEGPGSAP